MKKKRKILGRKLLSFLLTLALVLGLMPGMSMTAYADGNVASVTVGETTTNYTTFSDAVSAWNSAMSGAALTLLSDVATDNTINVSGTKTLDLNGYGIQATGTGYSVITVGSGANLTLNDTGSDTTGFITGGVASFGGGININGGTVKMNGGNLTGNTASGSGSSGRGGGVYVINGSFELRDGIIEGNKATNGGGVAIGSSGTFTMSGGVIQYNDGLSGGVLLTQVKDFTISGGAIQYNAGSAFGGIGIDGNLTIQMSGAPVIKGNVVFSDTNEKITKTDSGYTLAEGGTPSDVRQLNKQLKININSALTSGAAIGISQPYTFTQTDAFTTGFKTYHSGNEATEFFFSNDARTVIAKDANGELIIADACTVTFNANGHGTEPASATVASGSVITAPTAPTADGYNFGGWYKEQGCTNEWNFASDTVTAATTLYAKWTPVAATAPTINSVTGAVLTVGYTEGSVSVSATVATDTTYNSLTYQWYSNTTNSNSNGTEISGATSASYAVPTGKAAGATEYYYCVVTATRTDNSQTATATSDVATVTVNEKGTQTITASDVAATYGDADKKVEAATDGNGAISYAVKDGSAEYIDVDASTGALTIKKAGTATVVVTAAETGTYAQATKEVTVTINKANAVAATVTANNRTYDGTDKPLINVDDSTLVGGTMYYVVTTENKAPTDENLYTTSIPTATDAGTYYVWYKVVGDENHNDTDAANVPVVIAKADPDYTVPNGLTAVYGDTLQDVILPAGWTWAEADQIVGDAGTNTFKANYVPTDVTNYSSVENVDVTVSVSKGNGAVAVAPEVTAWTSDYVSAEAVNGQEYVIVKKGETPDWSKAVTPDKGSVTFTGLTPATEYSIYIRVKETKNTFASEPMKVDVLTSLIGWETRGEPKTGETITIIPDPENAEGLTWQWYYAEEDNEENVVKGEAIPGATGSSYVVKDSDLGKYLYYVISKGGKELETGYAGPVKIAINVTVALKDWSYGEAPNTPVVTGNTGNGKVSFTYAKKGSEEPESETVPKLPGTYMVFAYVEESGDYAFGYAEADFTITKGTPAVIAPKARNLVYTGASQELVEAGVAVGGEMQYALGTETVETQPYATSIPTATDAGTYYVWYKAVGDENHSDSVPACVSVVIGSKESVEGEVTFNKGEGSDEIPETLVESVESSDLTEFAETQKEEGKEVKVELEITPKKEADIVQTSVDGTKQIAEGLFVGFDTEKVVTEYFDIDLTKYVDDVKQDNIADTGSPIEIALKYDKTKMFNPVVVRTHKGETVEFSKLNARPAKADYKDATYYVGDGMIYLYSQFFSDYAIIYSTVKTYNVVIVTGTSDKISKTVAEGSKVDLPTGLSKSGYTFGGWFSDEACTKVWNVNDTVTADIKIYAKWTKNTAPYVPSTPVETPTPTPTATPTPTETPTVTPAPVKDSITAEEAASGSIKLNAGFKVYPKKSDIVVKWGKIDNADRYVIYAAYCKKGRKCAKIATLDGDVNSYKFSELNGKPINTKKNIKVYVVAYRKVNGKYKKITSSITAHIVGSGSKKYSNVKGINVVSTKITLSLDDNSAAPSSITLKPTAVPKDSSKKILRHTAEFRYATSKSSVAAVGKDGTITAKGKGTCYIYVYAQNGYAKKVKVTVK